LKILRKISFHVLAGQSGPLGRTVRGFLICIQYLSFLAKVFEKMCFQADCTQTPGGRSVILNITGCSSVDRADGPRPARGHSAGPRRTVRGVLVDGPPAQRSVLRAVDFTMLPLEFKCGQSARASRTVREVRILPITASNWKGEYIYSKPGVGEPLLAL
jgi:hypothetical protein